MTPDAFRKLALGLPQSYESCHMDHPDFRIGKRVFATLGYPRQGWGMVKLTPSQQARFTKALPEIFAPVKGAWGLRGATQVCLRSATLRALKPAMLQAWSNVAPRGLAAVLTDAER